MTNVIKIKRSNTVGSPTSLADGELAYSSLTDTGANGGDRLYIGTGDGIVVIGGKYFTTTINNATNANTASTIVKRNASGDFSAGTITAALSGNASTATALETGRTISITGDIAYTSTSFDGSANVTADATLVTVLDGTTNKITGTFGSSTAIPVVTVDTKGRITSITTSSISTSISLSAGSGTGSVAGGGTLTVSGGTGITTSVSGSTVTISSSGATGSGYATTTTAAETTTLTSNSARVEFFTGTTTQTVVLPVTNTLVIGDQFSIFNSSTGTITVQSSGTNPIVSLLAGQAATFICVLTSGTSAASWTYFFDGAIGSTGSGSLVYGTSPTLTTPTLGVASATSINKVAITEPTTGSTLTIADGKTLTVSNTITFSGTDASSVDLGSGGTVVYTTNTLAAFASTTSEQLADVISDETGTGALVFATSPSLTTPVLGAATATSITASTGALSLAAAAGNNDVTLSPTGTGTVDVSTKRITNVATPSNSTDAANKGYVDGVVSGLNIHASVDVFADSSNTQVTGAVYAAGTSDTSGGLGIGATLTDATAGQVLLIDGYTVASGDRVLVNSFTSTAATKNGIYTLTTVGDAGTTKWVLTRATDYNNSASAQVDPGDFVFIYRGTTYAKTGWVQTTVGTSTTPAETIVIGTDQIVWTQFSGAGTYTAGTGLTLTGGVFSVDTAQTQIDEVGTITSGTWNGTVIDPTYGGTGVNNGDRTLTLAGNVSHTGSFTQTFTATANTSLTLPTSGTLATLAGSETLTNKTLSTPTINGGSHTAITSFALRDTSAEFDVTLAATSSTALTAARTLTLDMVNAARTISLGGNLSLAANLTTSGANALTLTTSGETNVTLPTTGTLATLAGSETLTSKTLTGSSIGSTDPSTGAFTTLEANSTVSFTSTTDATALGTAPVVLSGGLSVAKAMYIGTNISGAGTSTSALYSFSIDGGTY